MLAQVRKAISVLWRMAGYTAFCMKGNLVIEERRIFETYLRVPVQNYANISLLWPKIEQLISSQLLLK